MDNIWVEFNILKHDNYLDRVSGVKVGIVHHSYVFLAPGGTTESELLVGDWTEQGVAIWLFLEDECCDQRAPNLGFLKQEDSYFD